MSESGSLVELESEFSGADRLRLRKEKAGLRVANSGEGRRHGGEEGGDWRFRSVSMGVLSENSSLSAGWGLEGAVDELASSSAIGGVGVSDVILGPRFSSMTVPSVSIRILLRGISSLKLFVPRWSWRE